MSDEIVTLLRRDLHEIFGERDAGRRRRAIAELVTEDCVFVDPSDRHVGRAALDAAVVALQARFPDFVFVEIGTTQAIPGAGRLAWGFGPQGEAPRITGLDVAIVRGGRIAALYTFIDAPPG